MYVCTYVPKYNLLGLYDVTCMYVLRADHLALDNQLTCSSLGKLFLPSQHFSVACSSLCKAETSWAFPHLLWRVHPWSAHTWAVMLVRFDGVASAIIRRHRLTASSLLFWLLESSQAWPSLSLRSWFLVLVMVSLLLNRIFLCVWRGFETGFLCRFWGCPGTLFEDRAGLALTEIRQSASTTHLVQQVSSSMMELLVTATVCAPLLTLSAICHAGCWCGS